MRIVIIGGGGHARVVADILLAVEGMEPVGFVTAERAPGTPGPFGLPVLGGDDAVDDIPHDGLVVAVGDNGIRRRLFEHFAARGETFVNAVHPTAILAPDVVLGRGCMVCPGAIVNTGSVIGDDVILNTGSVTDHDCRIGDHAHVAPGAKLAGAVRIGAGVLVGLGAAVLPGVSLGDGAVAGAGAVVLGDVPAGSTVVGVPARPKT
ncbi:sugar O-acyltransferase, sialic acid O-acetyltransferase NeuD family [Pseudodesulfovibrio mercurii]|uniref:Sugar O-acyltransferase, sialic acid O-acetyltransferase NeuD family n=1 Tax=Pseudodesulfovibrio mercurii TaxID=641491 RepID=F0JGS6_9BACT|nr:acetyltransferase [Pseudodesulfovibrio mercurii]EGB15116.1 sugar O-acyltransferase, sialic acid O-acetyltransferase NeuD family [Pseudodesulfovibrio mercurii]